MKALTMTQPWATLVALEEKHVETRSWATKYRGPLAIHAAKGFPKSAKEFAVACGLVPDRLPLGMVLCVVELFACLPTEEIVVGTRERSYGDYSPGRWAWKLRLTERLREPVPATGHLSLWDWDCEPERTERCEACQRRLCEHGKHPQRVARFCSLTALCPACSQGTEAK